MPVNSGVFPDPDPLQDIVHTSIKSLSLKKTQTNKQKKKHNTKNQKNPQNTKNPKPKDSSPITVILFPLSAYTVKALIAIPV